MKLEYQHSQITSQSNVHMFINQSEQSSKGNICKITLIY